MYDGFVFHLNLASWRVVYFGNWIFIAIIIIIILSMYCCCSFSLRWCFCCFFHLFSFWLLVCCFCCFSSCCLCCLRSSAFASFLPAPPPLPPPPAPPAPAPQPPQPPPPPPPKQNVIWQWIPHLWIRCVNWRTRLMGGDNFALTLLGCASCHSLPWWLKSMAGGATGCHKATPFSRGNARSNLLCRWTKQA